MIQLYLSQSRVIAAFLLLAVAHPSGVIAEDGQSNPPPTKASEKPADDSNGVLPAYTDLYSFEDGKVWGAMQEASGSVSVFFCDKNENKCRFMDWE